MSFIWPNFLLSLLLIPVLIGFYLFALRRKHRYAVRYASLSLVRDALGKGPGFRRHIPPIVFLLGLTVMLVALARPAATVILPSQQGTVILTIDISGSMQATDLKPTRLDAAKAAALAFIEKQPPSIRIGVVSFSEMAAVVQPPTTDREAVIAAINRLSPQRGTAIGSAILTSIEAIFEPPAPPVINRRPGSDWVYELPTPTPTPTAVPRGEYAPAIAILLSDGESNRGPRPLDVVNQALKRGVRIYTVGVGNPDGTILNVMGQMVRVRLDEETMKKIATETDGSYFVAKDEAELVDVYRNLGTEMVLRPERTELTAFFTLAAILILLLAAALSLLWFNRVL